MSVIGRGTVFGPLVIAYLFLGGAGAGACVLASAIGLLVPAAEMAGADKGRLEVPGEYRRLLAPSLVVAVGAVGVGVFCLLADLGNPTAALGILANGLGSWANVGVVALVSCVVVSLLQLVLLEFVQGVRVCLLRMLQVLGIVAGLLAAAYTGLLLGDMSGAPFWHSPWLPVLFALSACNCGYAVFTASAVLSGARDSFVSTLPRFVPVSALFILLEAAALTCFVSLCGTGGGDVALATASASVAKLLTGNLSVLFWVGVVFAGLFVPFAMELLAMRFDEVLVYRSCVHVLVSALSSLVGALCLRYCVVMAGMHPFLGLLGVAGVSLGL